jgi:hypothetical protein
MPLCHYAPYRQAYQLTRTAASDPPAASAATLRCPHVRVKPAGNFLYAACK